MACRAPQRCSITDAATIDDELAATRSRGFAIDREEHFIGLHCVAAPIFGPAVVFLASDAAAMVSGTSLAVTGGDSANVTA